MTRRTGEGARGMALADSERRRLGREPQNAVRLLVCASAMAGLVAPRWT